MPNNAPMKLASLIFIALAAITPSILGQDRTPTWFVFLVKGDNPPKAAPDEISQYQKAHIDNFKRLFDEGKLVTAGPLQDKTQVKRGIVVFCVRTKEEVIGGFAADPYVQKGFMKVEAFAVIPEYGKLNTSGIDPTGIVENRIAILEGASLNAPPEVHDQHLAYLQKEGPKVGLAFYGKLSGPQSVRGVALFKGKDDQAITAWLEQAPLVKAGTLKCTLMPQWLSQGVL